MVGSGDPGTDNSTMSCKMIQSTNDILAQYIVQKCKCPEPKDIIDGKGCYMCKTCGTCGTFLGCWNLAGLPHGSKMPTFEIPVIKYDIWKVAGNGYRRKTRYYESEKQFVRYGQRLRWKTFREKSP